MRSLKHFKLKQALHSHRKKIILSGLIFFSLALYPLASFQLANLFFGESKPLYNLSLAHSLFFASTHPILEAQTPQFAHYQLARTYFIRGDLYKTVDEAKRELRLYPDSVAAYYILGLSYGYLGRLHEGIDMFTTYIDAHPGTWAGRNDKAWLQFRIGDMDGAIVTIEPIAQQFAFTPWVQNTYCTLLINAKRYTEAKNVCAAAKKMIEKMTPEEWGRAYPGNDPRIYEEGLQAMKKSVTDNLAIALKNGR